MKDLIIYNTPDGRTSVALYAKDGNIWLNQSQIAELFATSKPNISLHINNIFKDNELDRDSVVKYYLTTASDGKEYNVEYYSLQMIIAIGYRALDTLNVTLVRYSKPMNKTHSDKFLKYLEARLSTKSIKIVPTD